MNTSRAWVSVCVLVGLLAGTASALVVDTVPVGNAGNVGELSGRGAGGYGPDRICGSVAYDYRIGKYEVTAGQYAEFLNAVAGTDTYGLYNTNMSRTNFGSGITRSGDGTIGNPYTYSVASEFTNRPVNYVSWGDSARFANWLHNNQPTGAQGLSTTEDGAYYLNGATSDAALLAVDREADATCAITSEDEWYKAAYYKGSGTNAGYWDYPTSSNSGPGRDMADASGNNANYYGKPFPIDSPYYTTVAGEFQNSESPYGTFDQGGNVQEWNEAIFPSPPIPKRGVRDGSFDDDGRYLHASNRTGIYPTHETYFIGFRVSTVPGPAPLSASLDILPSDDLNLFVPNRKGKGKIPMAIFATKEVAAEDIEPTSILIAGVISPLKTSTDKDVDGDGLVDLVMHFSRRDLIDVLSLDAYRAGGVVEVTVTAVRVGDDWPIEAMDSVVIAAFGD